MYRVKGTSFQTYCRVYSVQIHCDLNVRVSLKHEAIIIATLLSNLLKLVLLIL